MEGVKIPMKKVRAIFSESLDPYLNLALEEWLLGRIHPGDAVLFLWRNKNTVVIGRCQNPWAECQLDLLARDGVTLARRPSGGGAVFHDLGNTNFTFLNHAAEFNKNFNTGIIVESLRSLGIIATHSGRNDILVEGRKVSGSAFRETPEGCFHHGTLLVDVDLQRMAMYLTPDRLKLASKGVSSVKARVANLSSFCPNLEHERLSEHILESFRSACGVTAIGLEKFSEEQIRSLPGLFPFYEKFSGWHWLYGKTPLFTHKMSGRFGWGGLEILFDVKNGLVEGVQIFSDCLDPDFIENMEKSISGLAYEKKSIADEFLRVMQERKFSEEEIASFVNWWNAQWE
jgi:lipoate-protein ligase A